jgi:hypothetical protein
MKYADELAKIRTQVRQLISHRMSMKGMPRYITLAEAKSFLDHPITVLAKVTFENGKVSSEKVSADLYAILKEEGLIAKE